jgi:hypothetical protein
MIDKAKNTVKHSTERATNNSERYNRFFQAKSIMTIHQFEKHLKK